MKTQKTIFLFLLIGIVVPNCSYSQDVFPESDAIWNIQVFSNGDWDTEYRYGLSGDTIINDKKYNKMYFLNDTLLNINEDFYVGGIREENKQVWFQIRPNFWGYDIDEYVLYDFSKEEGDVIEIHEIPLVKYFVPTLFEYDRVEYARKIMKIEETPIGKTFHVMFSITTDFFSGDESQWIEGIGSLHGLFWEHHDRSLTSPYIEFKLACLKLGNEIKYLNNSECNSCFCLRNTDSKSLSNLAEKRFSVINNQQTSFIEIVMNQIYSLCYFELINLQGQVLTREKISSIPQLIPYNAFDKGLYFYRISGENGIFQTGKIVLN
jgi:hypothetical protein